MSKKNFSTAHGFTLVEILVCVVLFSGLILVVSSTYSFIRRTFIRVDGKGAASSEIERFLFRLDGELRSAREVIEPSSDSKSDKIVFYNSDGNQIGYKFSGSKIIRTEFLNRKDRTIMEKVDTLSFSRFSPGLVEIVVSSQKVAVMTAVHVWNLP